MKKVLSNLIFSLILLCSFPAVSAEKVVVIPLESKKTPVDSSLLPENIKKGVTIFDITGLIGIAWGCRYDSVSEKWIWTQDACIQDCAIQIPLLDCTSFCSDLSNNTDIAFLYGSYFCNGNGGY